MSEAATERPLRPVDEPQADSSLSVLGQLKDRRAQIASKQHLDLPVPRWENPVIIVRYKPVEHALFRSAGNAVDKAAPNKKAEVEINVNSDILNRACDGVYAIVDGNKYSLRPGDPDGEPTLFDADLAENLGCDHTARAVIKKLYITEQDILAAANALAEWVGYKNQEADSELMGE